MKNTDKSISFQTNTECPICKNSRIFEKCTLHVISGSNNGIIGPGYQSWQNTKIAISYYCRACGVRFEPTRQNNLSENTEKHVQFAEEKFKNTEAFVLMWSLKENQVYWLNENSADSMFLGPGHPLLEEFVEGAPFLMYAGFLPKSINQHHEEPDFSKYPYFVKDGETCKIVFWAEYVYDSRPLSEEEKGAIRTEYEAYQKRRSENIGLQRDYSLELRFKGVDTTTVPFERKSEPLPDDCVRVVKVFSPVSLKDFYIPLGAVSALYFNGNLNRKSG